MPDRIVENEAVDGGSRDDSTDSYRYPTLSVGEEGSIGMTEFQLCQLPLLTESEFLHFSLLTESDTDSYRYCHPGGFCHPKNQVKKITSYLSIPTNLQPNRPSPDFLSYNLWHYKDVLHLVS